jgi:hybrid polyketide synthase/nonribosomal peptide synthetase ACE1
LRIKGGLLQVLSGALRWWFLKELDTDMPDLEILGGISIHGLASDAVERIPKALLDLERDGHDAGNNAKSMGDKKLPKTSSESSSSDVMTGDSDTVS